MKKGAFCSSSPIANTGRTLLELIATLAIAASVTGFSAPGFFDWLADTRLVTQTNNLIRDLHYARTAAITSGAEVMLCASIDHNSCSYQREWHTGWIIFADVNGNRQRDPEENLLAVNTGFHGSIEFRAQGRYGFRHVVYRPVGSAKNGTFTLCDTRGVSRAVVLHLSGRPRIAEQAADGSPLVCPP